MDKAYGPLLIGTFVGLVFYGIVLHQVYRYSRTYSSDRVELKVAVYLTLILETAHMALSCYSCYYYLVSGYFKPTLLLYATHPAEFLTALTGLIIGTSHAFFARRAYLFDGRYKRLVLLAVAFLITGIGFSIATTIIQYHDTPKGTVGGFKGPEQLVTFGVKRTDSMMDVLVLYTIGTGLITSISILSLLLVVAIVPSMVGLQTGISIIVTQFFANAFLTALNSRESLNDRIAPRATGIAIFETGYGKNGGSHTYSISQDFIASRSRTHSQDEENLTDAQTMPQRRPNEGTKELDIRRDVLHIC